MTRARARFFYPASCHPPGMTRRQLLVGSGAVLAASALDLREGHAGADGTAVIERWATRSDDPWAVCHGVRAMGRAFTIEGGRRAVDWLLEAHLAESAINGATWLAFPVAIEVSTPTCS